MATLQARVAGSRCPLCSQPLSGTDLCGGCGSVEGIDADLPTAPTPNPTDKDLDAKQIASRAEAIIFLDIDGVLNITSTRASDGLEHHLVTNLALVLRATNAHVVLCSTWRLYPRLVGVITQALSLQGCWQAAEISKTPLCDMWTRSAPQRGADLNALARAQRCEEILQFVAEAEFGNRPWVVVDDMRLENETIVERHVQPNPAVGFDGECVEKTLRLLKQLRERLS